MADTKAIDKIFSWKPPDLLRTGRIFYALSVVAFGVLHIIYGEFVTGRAPVWPSGLPGQLIWAYSSGVILIFLGIAMISGYKPRISALIVAGLILFWSLLRHLLSADWHWGVEMTQTGKSIALFGGALAYVASLPADTGIFGPILSHKVKQNRLFIMTGRITLSFFMIICGIEHFMFVDFVKILIPSWIPGNVFWTYFAGIALIGGGIGLLLNQLMRLAAILSGIMVFIWFMILHIPRAIGHMGDGNEWIAVFEALAVSGIAFMLSQLKNNQINNIY